MAAALRLLLRQRAAAPPSPMLRSLFPAPYSKATVVAAAASLPAAHGAPLSPPRLREVTPKKAPPIPKGELGCCKTVPSTMTDSAKSLPDKLKDLMDITESLKDMGKNIEEHEEMLSKALDDREVATTLFGKRLEDRKKLIAKIRDVPDDYLETHLAKVYKMQVDYDKDWAIEEAKERLYDEQSEMLSKKYEDYDAAFRRHDELARSITEELDEVEKVAKVAKVKKIAKVGAAVGLVGGLLLVLAKI